MARLLTQLFEVTELFDMQTRPELIMLQKTMVVVEGVARTLDPDLNMWRTAEPVVTEWVARNLGPVGRVEDAGRQLSALVGMVERLPVLAADLGRAAAATADLREAEAARGIGRHPLTWPAWIAAVALAVLAASDLF
jgi:ubiquinone biosynthesis protein